MKTHSPRAAVLAPFLALTLTACGALGMPGGGEERQTSAQAGSSAQVPTSEPASEPATGPSLPTGQTGDQTGGETAPQDQAVGSAQPAQVIASKRFDHEGRKVDVAINELRREGRLATLHFTVGVAEGEKWQVSYMLRAEDKRAWNVSGVSLIDTVNAKRHRTAFSGVTADDEGDCVCSATQGIFVSEGQSHSLYASFAAPPPDVTKVDVEIPRFGVFSDVPLS